MFIRMFQEDWQKDTTISYRVAYLLSRMFDTSVTNSLVAIIFLARVKIELSWFLVLALGNFILPMLFLIQSFRTKRIADLDLSSREERKVWVNFLALFWGGTFLIVWIFNLGVPRDMLMFQAWLALLGVINAIVTNFWKISGHTMVATGLSLWLAFLYNEWFLLLLPTFVPLVAWARYRTKKHTIAQLVAGAVSMLIATPLVWLLFGAP